MHISEGPFSEIQQKELYNTPYLLGFPKFGIKKNIFYNTKIIILKV